MKSDDEGSAPEPDTRRLAYRFGRFEFQPGQRRLLADGVPVDLGRRALEVLLALIESHPQPATKDALLDRAWQRAQVEEHNLAAQVSALRRLLGREAIATVSGRGYRFALPVSRLEHGSMAAQAEPAAAQYIDALEHGDEVLRFAGLEWRRSERAVLLEGQRVELGSRALDLLDVLITERHRIVPKRELLERVWPGMVVEENNLQVQISALRKSLGKDAVATVPGRGYRFTMRPAVEQAAAVPDVPRETPARTNLPHAVEALFGRTEELEQLGQLLAAHRLLTIVGAGGIGKTRVAQALAHGQTVHFPQGVWWVDLAALASADEVAPAIAAAARVELGPGDAARQLARALESRTTLIVLDNCEHLVEEVSRIAATVLDVASNVRFVATSQEALRIAGEQLFRLGGLRVPPVGVSLDQARRHGALLLLERRAQAVDARFALTEPLLPTAIDLCRQLDGMPLAIEMAAARIPQLGCTVLASACSGCAAARAPPSRGTRRCAPRWTGATRCSVLMSGSCCAG
jgi:DNA-binding winged helix-turn-helix (wHTH) protein